VVCDGNGQQIVFGILGQNNGGFAEDNSGDGRPIEDPTSTVTGKGANQSLITCCIDQANGGFENRVGRPADAPISTILTESRGHQGLISCVVGHNNNGFAPWSDPAEHQHTVVADGAGHVVMSATMVDQHGTGAGVEITYPSRTISADGNHHQLVTVAGAHIQRDFGESVGSSMEQPIGTVTGGGMGKAALVYTFLTKYFGTGIGSAAGDPMHTVTTDDRFGVVTVKIRRITYVIVDICMRMLKPRELYLAQGFRPDYIIDRGADGRVFTKTAQVHMCGNSVCPPVAAAIYLANQPELVARKPLRLRRAA
jgi:DNA (cytosine-5)-methyltransferase 1